MIVHTVIFWLKEDLCNRDKEKFKQEVEKLAKIASVENFYLGTPSATPKRPVVDDTYDFALTVALKDMAAHDHYQADPIHLDFIEQCKEYWQKVLIYDAD
ncbi:MAG: transcription-repair coupling factor [Verrucomicrobia bacterium TMED44]|nr:MAG: transcription-repair coupling factor [Verrucomicrobia bacterium TMED44]|tara:strand:+ start:124 stop:423 length:300 start_codon:yes stop_codon:yes gene_type:complete